jgi:hypothetical protein
LLRQFAWQPDHSLCILVPGVAKSSPDSLYPLSLTPFSEKSIGKISLVKSAKRVAQFQPFSVAQQLQGNGVANQIILPHVSQEIFAWPLEG